MQVDPRFRNFMDQSVLATVQNKQKYWTSLDKLLAKFSPRNDAILVQRDFLQKRIDDYYTNHPDKCPDEAFFRSINYITTYPPNFQINPGLVDPEIARISAPQLVVPVDNPRFLMNAINARWGVLRESGYDEIRFLNEFAMVSSGEPWSKSNRGERVLNWRSLTLETPQKTQILGVTSVGGVVFKHHELHFIVHADRVEIEAACTTIVDFEDSVAAVDAEDKVRGYGNFLRLIRGELQVEGKEVRKDIQFTDLRNNVHVLKGRSLLLNRNVGLHMRNSMIIFNGEEAYEGIVDAFVTVLISVLHDKINNSSMNNVYIVKPKLHGPEEVKFTVDLITCIERELGLNRNVIKLGIMDEERRTSVNLRACLYEARERVIFVNTGFLDRTGDEIHTCFQASQPVLAKAAIKTANGRWFDAYEHRNVMIALAAGFSGKAQIGKGMWAEPDNLQEMLHTKIAHPLAGANTAWVPSPAAAVLHAVHYHKVDVMEIQRNMKIPAVTEIDQFLLAELLTPPLQLSGARLKQSEIDQELTNNVQGILGYVVRWIDGGIGCSKIPDIRNVGLMEDRATLRISSQHIANWLKHGLVSKQQVLECLRTVADMVDKQNVKTRDYEKLTPNLEHNLTIKCAMELIFNGERSPNGYVAPTLIKWRRVKKAQRSKL